jgi:hypothetical protein
MSIEIICQVARYNESNIIVTSRPDSRKKGMTKDVFVKAVNDEIDKIK